MTKETRPQTYRVSDEVDVELRRLAKVQGGIDKALRVLLDIQEIPVRGPSAKQPDYHVEYDEGRE